MNAGRQFARLEERREVRRSGLVRPFVDGLLIAFTFWALAAGALIIASYMNLDSAPGAAGPGAASALTATAATGGPGRFAYWLAAAIACWTLELAASF